MVWWWWVVRICLHRDAPAETASASPLRRTSVDATILGLLLALCVLCRPTFLVWAAMLVGGLAFLRRRRIVPQLSELIADSANQARFQLGELSDNHPQVASPRAATDVGPAQRQDKFTMISITLLVFVLGVGVWTLRNVAALGHPVWGTTHGGYTLLLANNDSFYDYLETQPAEPPWRRHAWEPDAFFAEYQLLPRSGDEWADDRFAYAAAKSTITHRPKMFWYSCWVRLTRLWQPFPHATAGRSTTSIVAVGVLHSLVYALIGMALLRHIRRFRPRHWRGWMVWWPAAALAITLSTVHAVYWSNPRMRSPAIPALSIVAAAAFVRRRD